MGELDKPADHTSDQRRRQSRPNQNTIERGRFLDISPSYRPSGTTAHTAEDSAFAYSSTIVNCVVQSLEKQVRCGALCAVVWQRRHRLRRSAATLGYLPAALTRSSAALASSHHRPPLAAIAASAACDGRLPLAVVTCCLVDRGIPFGFDLGCHVAGRQDVRVPELVPRS